MADSFFQQKGISISASTSILATGAPSFNRSLSSRVSSYQHQSSSFGGFKSCSFDLNTDIHDLEYWFVNGLGADIRVADEAGATIWRGFADQISVTYGQYDVSIGPLINVANAIDLRYTTKRYNTNPPIGGNTFLFGEINNTSSQNRYGTLEGQYQVSNVSGSNEVSGLTDALLAKLAFPDTGRKLSLGGGSEPKVSVKCLGYISLLDKMFVELDDSTVTLSQKIMNLLEAATLSDAVYSDFSGIEKNSLSVKNGEDGSRTILNALKYLESLGDSGKRQSFGIYDSPQLAIDRGSVSLITSVGDDGQEIRSALSGNEVYPWSVRPSQRLLVTDFLVGRNVELFGENDPRIMYIDQVSYTAPYNLSLQGGNIHTIDQKLAQLGLGGS